MILHAILKIMYFSHQLLARKIFELLIIFFD
jgi:hypothetical protein